MEDLNRKLKELRDMLSDAMITQIDLELKIKLVCKLNEALTLSDVSQQRELLLAFAKFMTNHITGATDKWREENVDIFLCR